MSGNKEYCSEGFSDWIFRSKLSDGIYESIQISITLGTIQTEICSVRISGDGGTSFIDIDWIGYGIPGVIVTVATKYIDKTINQYFDGITIEIRQTSAERADNGSYCFFNDLRILGAQAASAPYSPTKQPNLMPTVIPSVEIAHSEEIDVYVDDSGSDSHNEMQGWEIALIVIGIIGFCLITAGTTYRTRRWLNRRQEVPQEDEELEMEFTIGK